MNGRGVRGATDAHTGRQPRLSHWPGKPDAIFVYLTETLADSCRREFCMAAEQTLLALSRAEDRIGRMIVADAWRWMPGVALRSLQARGSGNVWETGSHWSGRRGCGGAIPPLCRAPAQLPPVRHHSRTPCPALCAALAGGGYLQSVRGGLLPDALGFERDVLRTG